MQLRNMLVTDDEEVCLVGWHAAACLKPVPDIALPRCTEAELDWELRKVKYLLDHEGARETEKKLWEDTDRQKFVFHAVQVCRQR